MIPYGDEPPPDHVLMFAYESQVRSSPQMRPRIRMLEFYLEKEAEDSGKEVKKITYPQMYALVEKHLKDKEDTIKLTNQMYPQTKNTRYGQSMLQQPKQPVQEVSVASPAIKVVQAEAPKEKQNSGTCWQWRQNGSCS